MFFCFCPFKPVENKNSLPRREQSCSPQRNSPSAPVSRIRIAKKSMQIQHVLLKKIHPNQTSNDCSPKQTRQNWINFAPPYIFGSPPPPTEADGRRPPPFVPPTSRLPTFLAAEHALPSRICSFYSLETPPRGESSNPIPSTVQSPRLCCGFVCCVAGWRSNHQFVSLGLGFGSDSTAVA